jgi:hypothetical protein
MKIDDNKRKKQSKICHSTAQLDWSVKNKTKNKMVEKKKQQKPENAFANNLNNLWPISADYRR